jgi:hypothetical protein
MTEKIEKLIKEAKNYTKKYKKEMNARGYYHDDDYEIFNKKFAELIIQECIEIGCQILDNNQISRDVSVKIEEKIKVNFGIKNKAII